MMSDLEHIDLQVRAIALDQIPFRLDSDVAGQEDPSTFDFTQVEGSGLGILRDPARNVLRDKEGFTKMSAEIRHFLTQPEPLIIILIGSIVGAMVIAMYLPIFKMASVI